MRPRLLLLVLAGCGPTWLSPRDAVSEGRPPQDFLEAARAAGVPVELLLADAQAATRFHMADGAVEFPGRPAVYGVLGLTGEDLDLGAALAGVDPTAARTERRAHLLAGAALLAEEARALGITEEDPLDDWAPAVAALADLDDDEATAGWVHHEVYRALATGFTVEGYTQGPRPVDPAWPAPVADLARSVDGGAVWTGSPNYDSRWGTPVQMVVIHTCEGSYSGCWSWLTNPAAQASAHYVVAADGSEVRALVDETDRAWHVAANYDCANNGGADCWLNGTSVNTMAVGIEHAGYASQAWWDPAMLQRSAELTCGITARHGVVRDRYHIVGHGQLQPWDRTDPGPNWPWDDYVYRVQQACGDLGGGTTGGTTWGGTTTTPEVDVTAGPFVIDSNDAANVEGWTATEPGWGWWGSANVGGYWNTGYWIAPSEAVSDPTSFWFWSSDTRCYTVDAWWTAATDRSRAVTFMGWNEQNAEVGRATVNQRRRGARWNTLGQWTFGPGWNRVLVSRWTSAPGYAVADAVRLTPCP